MAARVTCRCGFTRTYPTRAKAEFNAARHICKTNGIRRATRSYRCSRCGYEATYPNAGATEARSWFNRHSCQRQERLLLKAALAEQRHALVDRTPKPCHHKQADHQHGTYACYVLDRCRCRPCADANAAYESNLNRQKAYGRYNKYVMGEHVRAHLAELAAYGIGLKRVAALSGVSTGTLSKIVFGVYANTSTGGGRAGPGDRIREPSRRVLRKTAEAIFDVEATPANLGAGQHDRERTPLARAHLRALVALGWSMSELGRRLGIKYASNAGLLIESDRLMQRRTVDAAEALFEQLCMTLPPEDTQRQRIAASRSRKYARDRGWVPPLALDDDLDEAPPPMDQGYDEAAVERALSGDRTVRMTLPDRREVVRRATAQGWSAAGIEATTGITTRTVDRYRAVTPPEEAS